LSLVFKSTAAVSTLINVYHKAFLTFELNSFIWITPQTNLTNFVIPFSTLNSQHENGQPKQDLSLLDLITQLISWENLFIN